MLILFVIVTLACVTLAILVGDFLVHNDHAGLGILCYGAGFLFLLWMVAVFDYAGTA